MPETEKIRKAKAKSPSADYNYLREQGLKYLRRIAGKIWTDYNLHDPGVTILEQLCYAITDLGYRASFSMKDLLAVNPESTANNKNFYTAAEILPSNPVTINDDNLVTIEKATPQTICVKHIKQMLDENESARGPENKAKIATASN